MQIREPLWWDEVASARAFTQPSLPRLLAQVRRTEASPPGWYALAWLFHQGGRAVGGTVPALAGTAAPRVLSVACAALTAGLATWYAARWMPPLFAATAGATTALADQSLEHGSELRAYALLTCSAVVLAVLLDATARSCTRNRLAGLAAVSAFGCWMHYDFVLVLAAAGGWVALAPMTRSARVRMLGSMALGVSTLAAWLPAFVPQYRTHSHYFTGAFNAATTLGAESKLLAGTSAWNRLAVHGTTAPARVVPLVTIAIGAAILVRRPDAGLWATLAVLPVILAAALWAAGLHVFDTRNLIMTVPFGAVCIAAAIGTIPHRRLGYLTAAAVLAGLALAVVAESGEGRTRYDQVARDAVALGWNRSEPLLVFARSYPNTLSWYLPGHPLLSRGRLTGRSCGRLIVVSQTPRGAAWIDSITVAARRVDRLAWYGTQAYSPQLPGQVTVARLPFSPSLARAGFRAGGVLRMVAGTSAPCMRAIPGTRQAY